MTIRNSVRAHSCRSGGNGGEATIRVITSGMSFYNDGSRRNNNGHCRTRRPTTPSCRDNSSNDFSMLPSGSSGSNVPFNNTSSRSSNLPFWALGFSAFWGRSAVVTGREATPRTNNHPVGEGREGIYTFYISGIRRVSCGSATGLHHFASSETGVLPHEMANAYTCRRERLAGTVGETHRVTLLPCASS